MIERNLLGAIFCLPLALLLWQGSSCHSNHANANNNSARDDRRSANANVNSPNVNNNSRTTPAPVDLTGTWGGDHISMEVTQSGASIEYDCAHGTISEKIVPNSDGHFAAQGSHAREAPGPTRQGEDGGQPATYRGSLVGDTMELTVTLAKSNETVGTFTLTHGKTGRLRKCR
jgi:hypothetical protein